MTRDTAATRAWLGLPPDADEAEVAATRDALEDFLADAPEDLAGWAQGQRDAVFLHRTSTPTTTGGPQHGGSDHAGTSRRRRSPLVPLGIAAAAALLVVGVYHMGDTSSPAEQSTPAAASNPHASGMPTEMPTQPTLDQAKVDRLTKQIEAEPTNTRAMKELANEYSRAGHYRKASQTQARIVELEPDNVDALLALGVAHFNMDDLPAAEKHWNAVLKKDPKNANAYYDLGFLYFAKNPPEIDKAEVITKIMNDQTRQQHVDDNKDLLQEQAKAFYEGIIKTVQPDAVLEFEFRETI